MRLEIGDRVRWADSFVDCGVFEVVNRHKSDDGWRYDIKGQFSDGFNIREDDLEFVGTREVWDREAL